MLDPTESLVGMRGVPSKLLAFGLLMLVFSEGRAGGQSPPEPPVKRLIEFGWDEPDTAFLRRNIEMIEKTPFDGCVFHVMTSNPEGRRENFTWLGWGRRAFRESDFQAALDDLKATPFRRFTRNFLRFNTAPGDLDWFDDYGAILGNARLAAKVARAGKCAGILFDVEEYEGGLFTYSMQRDAKSKSWDQYADQAKRRGREVMGAFQEGFPGLTVFLTFGHTLALVESDRGEKTLAESRYGLLAPFLDGMVEAAREGARIVDGFELSYGYREPEKFDEGYRLMKEGVLPIVDDGPKYGRVVSAGFGLWLDYDWRKKGWDVDDPSKNYFTPDSFEASLRRALERSDEYVWIYTESPRWWSEGGKGIALPDAYETAIRQARRGMTPD
ncbi:hypothetical protein P12x_002941 [Tundrisphaera lichenicola]|uniref:hypothetical protein n=1 Tax=Tundrisphaera lichenicola TaxID=2029860 RepID=UPI003EBB0895